MSKMPRMYRTITSFAVLSAALTGLVSGQAPDTTFKAPPPQFADNARRAKLETAFPEIDRIFKAFTEQAHVPGASWGIVIDGELAHAGVTGLRDVASKAPVEADTVFRIASMTKSFTAMAILRLRDEGKLSLDDPAERYVPELKNLTYPTSDSPRVTIRHLLSHAEGFPEDNPWGDRQLADTDAQLTDMLRRGIPFSNAPGVAYEYSNYGFAILGRIVSRASGRPFADYIAATILRPLGMTATTLEPGDVPRGKLALGYRWEDGTWKEEPILAHGSFGAMGGMLTTVPDLARYVGVFLSAWPPRDGAETAPVRRASLREMQQVWRPAPGAVTRDPSGQLQMNIGGYGFGLRVSQTCAFRHVVAHSGGLPGYGSQMRWLPEYGVGIIAFGNLRYTGWGRPIDEAIDALARTGALQPRVAQPSPALVSARDRVSRLVMHWDAGLATTLAAENLFLDSSADRRHAQIDQLRATVGACTAASSFDHVENALRGDWTMNCERGRLQVAITLAPTIPPKVQFLSITEAPADGPVQQGSCAQRHVELGTPRRNAEILCYASTEHAHSRRRRDGQEVDREEVRTEAERRIHEADDAGRVARRGRWRQAHSADRGHEETLGLYQEERPAG
jgi:CubicO group peptidase (beta-lactamase class C family)